MTIIPNETHSGSQTMDIRNKTYPQILANLMPPAKPAPILPATSVFDSNLTHQIASLGIHPTLEALLHILNDDLVSAHFLVRHMQSSEEPKFSSGQQQLVGADEKENVSGSEIGSGSYASALAGGDGHGDGGETNPRPAATAGPGTTAEAKTQSEGQIIHALLHRIELDTSNAEAWYTDVSGAAPDLFDAIWPSSPSKGAEKNNVILNEESGPSARGDDANWSRGSKGDAVGQGLQNAKRFMSRIQRVRGTHPNLSSYENKFRNDQQNWTPDSTALARPKSKSSSERDGMDSVLETEVSRLRAESEREIRALIAWCERRFGTERYSDASLQWRSHGKRLQRWRPRWSLVEKDGDSFKETNLGT